MKKSILLTSVPVFLCLFVLSLVTRGQSTVIPVCKADASAVAKCTGASNCKACKNCSACAHCKNGGKCGVCRRASGAQHALHAGGNSTKTVPSFSSTISKPVNEGDYVSVEWSAKSLKPAVSTLKSLDVRSGPGKAFKVLGNVSTKDPLIIIGERDGWYKIVVRHADLVGFVEGKHVEIVR